MNGENCFSNAIVIIIAFVFHVIVYTGIIQHYILWAKANGFFPRLLLRFTDDGKR